MRSKAHKKLDEYYDIQMAYTEIARLKAELATYKLKWTEHDVLNAPLLPRGTYWLKEFPWDAIRTIKIVDGLPFNYIAPSRFILLAGPIQEPEG